MSENKINLYNYLCEMMRDRDRLKVYTCSFEGDFPFCVVGYHNPETNHFECRMFDFENRAEEFVIKIKAVIGHKS